MNRALFIQLLKEPALGGREHEADLRELVNQYPYFQAARAALTRTLHNQNSYLYEKELKTTALYAGNRRLLYNFIHPPAPAAQPAAEPVPETAEEILATIEAEVEAEEMLLPEPEPALVQEPEPVIISDRIDPVITPINEPEVTPEPMAEPEPETQVTPVAEEPVHIRPDEPHSFTEWLTLMQHTHVFDEPAPMTVAETEPPPVTGEPAEEPPVYQKNEAFDPNAIIDRFITENPSISRPKTEFFNPINVARQSIEEDDELVTETLARIYLKQGNYKKAIRIYEKLCLKFTDKMPYFVALIQKIRSENKLD